MLPMCQLVHLKISMAISSIAIFFCEEFLRLKECNCSKNYPSIFLKYTTSVKVWSVKPVFHLANLFTRTSKKRMGLAGDVVSVCHQPIKLLLSLFARTNSPSGKPA